MKISEVTVSLGRTIQVAPYQPLNYHLSYKIEIQEGDDEQIEIAHARVKLEQQVNEYIESFNKEEDVELPPQQNFSNKKSNTEPPTEQQKIWLLNYIHANIPLDQQEKAKLKLQSMTKAQAIAKIKSLTK